MWLPHTVSVQPVEEPVSLSGVKEHCAISGNADDGRISSYIKAARVAAENMCGSRFVTQTIVAKCSWWSDFKSIPFGPIQSISSITYLDENAVEQTLATTVYELVNGSKPLIRLKFNQVWPTHFCSEDAIRVTAVVGHGESDSVPEPIKQAIYLMVSEWNENREGTMHTSSQATLNGVRSLLQPYSSGLL